jgi:uncharacterized protein (TIGR03083 family)
MMARVHGTKELWLESLKTDGPAFLAAVEQGDPATDVPSCPGWTMADLTQHLGNVYLWVRLHIVRGMITKPERSFSELVAEPPAADLLGWWNDQYSSIMSTLDVLDPDMPAWNWAPQAKRAGFWHRRMALETAVHRWDAQMAVGRAEPVDVRFAPDGVAEALDSWLPAGRRVGPTTATGIVALHATDAEQNWLVRLRGEGVALLDTDTIFDDDAPARVQASGSASDLMLALWGRVSWDALDVTGDETLLEALHVG